MHKLLYQVYSSAIAKYTKFRKRLDKNIASGRFRQFTRRKQAQILSKVERLRKRALQLHTQMKLAMAGAALTVFLNATPAQAQTTVGPFKKNYLENPLPQPVPFYKNPASTYVDLDADGDLDLVAVPEYGIDLMYFENVGTATKGRFVQRFQSNPEFPLGLFSFGTYEHPTSVAFTDADADGDFDMLLGTSYGSPRYYRNNGNANTPSFEWITVAADNPFANVSVFSGYNPKLVFADVDSDGDNDLVVGGYYSSFSTWGLLIQFYKNESGVFTKQADTDNPFWYTGPSNDVNVGFADMDGDGDQDFLFAAYDDNYYHYMFHYRRNDGNGVFTEQTGAWVPDTTNPSNSSGNPLELPMPSDYISFSVADLDNDGDPDLTISYYEYTYPNQQRGFFFYQNAGDGTLSLVQGSNSPLDGIDMGNISSSALADNDNDGDLDIVAAGTSEYYQNETVYSYLKPAAYLKVGNSYVPSSEALANWPTSLTRHYGGYIKVVDVDTDGDTDIVVPYYDGANQIGKVQYIQNDNGVFPEILIADDPNSPFAFIPDYLTQNNMGSRPIDLDIADMNNDGKPDLILQVGDNLLVFFENISDTNVPLYELRPEWATGITQGATNNGNPKVIDIDGDGDKDIVEGKYHTIWYYKNIGTSTLPQFIQYKSTNYTNANNELIEAINNPFDDVFEEQSAFLTPNFLDADGDGDNDLLLGTEDGSFAYYENENPPAVTTVVATLNFNQGSTAVVLDSGITFSDPDNDSVSKIIIAISNFKPGEETLSFTPAGNVTGIFDAVAGTLTLSGNAPAADFIATLQTVSYQYTGAKPANSGRKGYDAGRSVTLNRSISFTVLDADVTTPPPAVLTMQISFPNSVPVVAMATSSATFTSSPVVIDAGVMVTDADDADLTGATVAIDAANFKSAEDQLLFTSQNGITGSYNTSSGVLTLTGTASVANYQTALQSVRYNNTATIATNQPRTVTFAVNDGEANSNVASISVNVNVATPNQPPAIAPNPVTTQIGESITVDLTTIVSDPNNNIDLATLKIITQPASGAVATITNSVLTVDYSALDFAGQDVLRVEVCDSNGACAQADININVEGDIIVHDAFSPNGDTFNQSWIISNITTLEPKNKVSLFTRWGDKVFEIDDYNNADRVFEGTSNSGKEIGSGTYFYKIEFASGRKTMTGYLIIKR